LHSTAQEKVKYPLIRKLIRASTLPDLVLATGTASRSKLNINESKNLGIEHKTTPGFTENGNAWN